MSIKYTIDKQDDELLFLLPLNGLVIVNLKGELEFSDIERLYEELVAEGCPQILFHNNVGGNKDMLNWLTPRLIGIGFIITLMTKLPQKLPEVVCSHLIVETEANLLFRLQDKLSVLTKDDVIWVTDPTVNVLSKINSKLINGEIKANIVFNKDLMSTDEIFEYKLFSMIPHGVFINDNA